MSALLPKNDVALLRDFADELQQGDAVHVALGALVRSCITWPSDLKPQTLGALCALADRVQERTMATPGDEPCPVETATYVPLPVKELFELPVGASFIVYYAKDNDAVNALRLNHAKQTITGYDAHGSILTDDGYEWQKEDAMSEKGNVLDTGRGYAFFYKVPA
jgi:hypothetical protein